MTSRTVVGAENDQQAHESFRRKKFLHPPRSEFKKCSDVLQLADGLRPIEAIDHPVGGDILLDAPRRRQEPAESAVQTLRSHLEKDRRRSEKSVGFNNAVGVYAAFAALVNKPYQEHGSAEGSEHTNSTSRR